MPRVNVECTERPAAPPYAQHNDNVPTRGTLALRALDPLSRVAITLLWDDDGAYLVRGHAVKGGRSWAPLNWLPFGTPQSAGRPPDPPSLLSRRCDTCTMFTCIMQPAKYVSTVRGVFGVDVIVVQKFEVYLLCLATIWAHRLFYLLSKSNLNQILCTASNSKAQAHT